MNQPALTQRPRTAPPAFHLLAKPTGAICNLDCAYCFFLDKETFYPGSKFRKVFLSVDRLQRHRVNKEVLRTQVDALDAQQHLDLGLLV